VVVSKLSAIKVRIQNPKPRKRIIPTTIIIWATIVVNKNQIKKHNVFVTRPI